MNRALATLLLLATAGPLQGQSARPRPGLWFEAGGGLGIIRIGCAGCADVTTTGGGSSYLRVGGTVSPRVLLGVEAFDFSDETFRFAGEDTTVVAQASTISIAVLWYPVGSRFLLKGGIGVAIGQFSVSPPGGQARTDRSAGVGLILGLGYDLPISRRFAFSVNAGSYLSGIGDVVLPAGRVEDVIASIYNVTVGLTIR